MAMQGSDKNDVIRAIAVWNLYQFQAAEVALQRASMESAQTLAAWLWQNHATMTEQLLEAAGNTLVPTSLDRLHEALIDDLRFAKDHEFDMLYLQQEMRAAEQAHAMLQDFAKSCDDPALKAFCRKALAQTREYGEKLATISAVMRNAP